MLTPRSLSNDQPARSGTSRHPKRLVLVNQGWLPDVAATAQLCGDLVQHLADQGWQVTVICGGEPRQPVDGRIQVMATGPSDRSDRKAWLRVPCWCLFIIAATIRLFQVERPDVIICSTSPPFLACGGAIVSLLRGSRLLVWCMDVHPEAIVAAGLARATSLLVRMLRWFDSMSLFRARRVVTLSESMRNTLLHRGLSPERVIVLPPWAPETVGDSGASAAWRRKLGIRSGSLVVGYAGNLGIGHDTATLLGALRETDSDVDIEWLITGGGHGHRRIADVVASGELRNVHMLGFVSRDQLAPLLEVADVHVVTLETAFEQVMFPSKFVSALGVGRCAIIVGSTSGVLAAMVHRHDCGRVVDPGDERGLAQAIRACALNRSDTCARGLRARSAYAVEFASGKTLARWDAILETALAAD